MAILSVFQGHWRALEKAWLREFRKNRGTLAVVTAGQPLASHLMHLIEGNTAGVAFFPGIPNLAKALADGIAAQTVSPPHRIALACMAGARPETSSATSSFFEKLIEMGVSAGDFDTIVRSAKKPNQTVRETSEMYSVYSKERTALYPWSVDRLQKKGPQRADRFDRYFFYGFYDLNPGQRRYVKLLSDVSDILWFSPLHQAHSFFRPFIRTSEFLSKTSNNRINRIDTEFPLSPKAQFAENMLTGKALSQTDGIELLYSGSDTAFERAVVDTTRKLLNFCSPSEIAVVARGKDAERIVHRLHVSGIRCNKPLTVRASSLPMGRLLERLLRLPDSRFHHIDIEKLLLTGSITMEDTPDAALFSREMAKKGIRFGLHALCSAGFPFCTSIHSYFTKLTNHSSAYPEVFLKDTLKLLSELTADSVPSPFTENLLSHRAFSTGYPVTFGVFREMVFAAMKGSIPLREADKDGVAVLSPETTRGILKKAVVITGLEEGVFPGRTINDPRLPPDMRKQLQLPSPETRETEEAFLLRQLFEAAQTRLTIICRKYDSSGGAVSVSPFLNPLERENSPLKAVTLSDSPLRVLEIPENPPFLSSSLLAQAERRAFDPENPSQDAVHCGMIGRGHYSMFPLTATKLELYARDPFSFLENKIWCVEQQGPFPVSSQPEPRFRGIIVHRCVEEVLKTDQPASVVVEDVCRLNNLEALLGSKTLAEIWMEQLTRAIEDLIGQLKNRGWGFFASEKQFTGKIAGFPAEGRVDLIFKNKTGDFVLVDIKTGKPKKIRARAGALTIIDNGLFQFPFYRNLALQNNFGPFSSSAYIHLESSGQITFVELSDSELESVNNDFMERVKSIVELISSGDFHQKPDSPSRKFTTWH